VPISEAFKPSIIEAQRPCHPARVRYASGRPILIPQFRLSKEKKASKPKCRSLL
jgi:hypothetical protein